MNRTILHATHAGLLLVGTIVASLAPTTGLMAQDRSFSTDSDPCRRLLLSAWSHVDSVYWNRAFVEGPWQRARETISDRDCEGGAHESIRRLLSRIDDPAVRIVDSAGIGGLLGVFQGTPQSGVGLLELLSVDVDERTRLLTVVTPVPGSPAARAGLGPGDVIERIDGLRSDTLDLGVAAAKLRGRPGTTVTLQVRRGRDVFDVELKRESVAPVDAVETAFRKEPVPIGYVRLIQFVPGTAAAVDSTFTRLARRGARGWILDLRDNPGGLADEMVSTAELLLEPGRPIARFASRPGGDTTLVTTGVPVTDLPVVVLVNRGSASAAEALAGALQVHGRATVIGERTYGKGLVHTLLPLADRSGIMVPNARLHTPRDRDILSRGIDPDVELASPTLHAPGAAGPEDPLVRAATDQLLRRLGVGRAALASDSAAVRAAALDYIEGWFEGDMGRVARALHPRLVKRILRRDAQTGLLLLEETGREELVARAGEGHGTRIPTAQRKTEVRISDLFQDVANVQIDAGVWIDYLHMVRWKDGWRIVNVLWELREQSASE